jgi:hypothetical protein
LHSFLSINSVLSGSKGTEIYRIDLLVGIVEDTVDVAQYLQLAAGLQNMSKLTASSHVALASTLLPVICIVIEFCPTWINKPVSEKWIKSGIADSQFKDAKLGMFKTLIQILVWFLAIFLTQSKQKHLIRHADCGTRHISCAPLLSGEYQGSTYMWLDGMSSWCWCWGWMQLCVMVMKIWGKSKQVKGETLIAANGRRISWTSQTW